MAAQIPTDVPSPIYAGSTIKFDRLFTDYPATAGWVYTIYVAGVVVKNQQATTVSGDDTFHVVLSNTWTEALTPGRYQYIERVALGGEVYTVAEGVLDVLLDLATATPGQAQTHEERMLAAISSVIEGRIPADIESYHIGGRSIMKVPINELVKLKGHYAALVWRQQNPNALGTRVEVQFNDTETWDFPATWVDIQGGTI